MDVGSFQPTQKMAYLSAEHDQAGKNWRVFIQHVFFQPLDDTVKYSTILSDEALDRLYVDKLGRARDYHRLFEYRKALSFYREADQLIPTDSINDVIRELFVKLQIIEARSIYTVNQYSNLLVRDAQNPDLYFERGLNYLRQTMYDLATEDLNETILLAPNYLKAYLVFAILNTRQQNQADALRHLASAMELQSEEEKLLLMAKRELEDNHFESAEKFILEALDWNSTFGADDKNLMPEMAMTATPAIVERSISDEELGKDAFDRGEWTQADLFFRKALIEQPENEALKLKSGECQLNLDNNESARRIAKQLISEHENMAEAYMLMGKACMKLKLFRDAKKAFKQAIKLEPDLKEAHRELALYYREFEDDPDRAAMHEAQAKQ